MTLESWLQSPTKLVTSDAVQLVEECKDINDTIRSLDAIESGQNLRKRKIKKVKIKDEIEIVEMESFKYYNMSGVDTINEQSLTLFSSSQEYCQRCNCSIF